jgi:hypothetical protein
MSGHTVPHTAPKAEGLNLLKLLQPSNKKRVQCHRHEEPEATIPGQFGPIVSVTSPPFMLMVPSS